jgi:hypothetical protein
MHNSSQQKPAVDVVAVFAGLASHPVDTFYRSWNWKSALLSAMLRSPIFLLATLRQGLKAISVAVAVEALYSAGISGCYGTFVQKLRRARPLWAAAALIVVVLPGLLLLLDYSLHRYTRMQNLRGGMVGACALSLLSSVFNWYLMSRNSLIVGEGAHAFSSDLKRMPRLLLEFVFIFPRRCARLLRT